MLILCLGGLYREDVHPAVGGMMRFEIYVRFTLGARREVQRTRRRPIWETERASYENLRQQLRSALKRSKKIFIQRICQKANVDPFGTAYKVVCKRISARGQPNLDCSLLLREIIIHYSPGASHILLKA